MIWMISIIALVGIIGYMLFGPKKGKKKKKTKDIKVMVLGAITMVWFIIGVVIMGTADDTSTIALSAEKVTIEAAGIFTDNDSDAKEFNRKLLFTKIQNSYYLFSFSNDSDLNAITPIEID